MRQLSCQKIQPVRSLQNSRLKPACQAAINSELMLPSLGRRQASEAIFHESMEAFAGCQRPESEFVAARFIQEQQSSERLPALVVRLMKLFGQFPVVDFKPPGLG